MLLDVRRLAAVDMWGSRGGRRRRRVIRAEFVVGAVGCTVLGVLGIVSGTGWLVAVGIWLIGVGVNYVPLALHARSLSRPGILEAELENADIRAELRRAGVLQLWIALPFAVALAALRQTGGN
jgi:hypothetical protein